MKKSQNSTIDVDEIRHFDAMATDWWDEDGAFRALHRLTPTRINYICQQVARFRPDIKDAPLSGLNILDIGCGGGLLAEPLTRLGAKVTAIDMSAAAIAIAKDHAKKMRLNIRYLQKSAEDLAAKEQGYDIVIASEVIEHVQNRKIFLEAIAQLGQGAGANMGANMGGCVGAGGCAGVGADIDANINLAIITTINRTIPATILAKYAAEYVLKLAPIGTHEPKKFISPQSLRKEAAKAGIILDDITGIRPSLQTGFTLGGPPIINYAATGIIKPKR